MSIKMETQRNTQEINIVTSEIFGHKSLEERAKEFKGKIESYEEFEWGEPIGRERW